MNAVATRSRVGTPVFDRVVCGVDRSAAGVIAARAAARVAAPEGSLLLVAVDDPSPAVHAGWGMPRVLEELADEAALGLERGRMEAEPLHEVETRLLKGSPSEHLLHEAAQRDATLIVVGSHGVSRARGITLGAVSTSLLHEAPCPVLIARGPVNAERWPRRIVVGIDGSPDSADALAAGRALAARLHGALRVVAATQDAHIDLEAARRLAPELEEHEGRAIDVLNVASEHADLVVVGSRGLRGLRALGSLSERLAHDARCSVLVVRPRTHAER
jgi:nucleotide-binding universal stress UspA family protein